MTGDLTHQTGPVDWDHYTPGLVHIGTCGDGEPPEERP